MHHRAGPLGTQKADLRPCRFRRRQIVEALNGAIASALGTFTLFPVALAFGDMIGARTAMLLGVVVFAAGALLLVPVREPPRDRPAAAAAAGRAVSA